jgi:hypothetical protein
MEIFLTRVVTGCVSLIWLRELKSFSFVYSYLLNNCTYSPSSFGNKSGGIRDLPAFLGLDFIASKLALLSTEVKWLGFSPCIELGMPWVDSLPRLDSTGVNGTWLIEFLELSYFLVDFTVALSWTDSYPVGLIKFSSDSECSASWPIVVRFLFFLFSKVLFLNSLVALRCLSNSYCCIDTKMLEISLLKFFWRRLVLLPAGLSYSLFRNLFRLELALPTAACWRLKSSGEIYLGAWCLLRIPPPVWETILICWSTEPSIYPDEWLISYVVPLCVGLPP